jgi:thioredoxin reductase (NADPH)
MAPPETYDLVIVGAGPAGLSCAIEAKRGGLSAVILDKGSAVDSLRRFPVNLIWFSTPELLEIGDVPFVIPSVRPTRVDVVNYYQRVISRHALDIRPFDAVAAVISKTECFAIQTEGGHIYQSRHVVLATGYFDNPNRLSVPGEDLPKVFHYYDEPFRYFNTEVAVVGGRNSAVEAALDLFRHGARVTLIHRGEKLSQGVKYWILPDILNRIRAGQITALFRSTVKEVRHSSVVIDAAGAGREIANDFVFVLVGFSPETSLLKRCNVGIDPKTLAPVHDAATLETDVPGLFVAGSIVAGKLNNKVFVENGRMHGGIIVRNILQRRG